MLVTAHHGQVRGNTVEEDVEGAHVVVQQLNEAGIDLQDITERRLIVEGVQSFANSFDSLLDGLRGKRDAVLADG